MIKKFLLTYVLIFTLTSFCYGNSEELKKNITGIWHILPCLPSGWSDNYHFYKNGTFRYDYNQMDGEKRIINISGTWKIINENMLYLIIKEKTIIKGGEFVKSEGSTATDYEIIKGKTEKVKLDPPEEIIYPVGTVEKDREYNMLTVKIGGRRFWKFSNNPDEF